MKLLVFLAHSPLCLLWMWKHIVSLASGASCVHDTIPTWIIKQWKVELLYAIVDILIVHNLLVNFDE